MTDTSSGYTACTELLHRELPDPRFVDDRYLEWLYDENPFGAPYQDSIDEGGERMAHYALVPTEYRDRSGIVPGVFSLNAVTRTGTQRKGYFLTLAKDLYQRAGDDGKVLVIGVPNAKSVAAGVKYLGWRLYGPMPVRILLPTPVPTGDVETFPATPELLASSRFEELAADLDDFPTSGITNRWTVEHLRWRLQRPYAEYVIHVTTELFAVSTRTVQRGLPAAVIMKLLPRGGRGGPLSPRKIVTSACKHHGTPVAAYAGYNEHVRLGGIRTPHRFQPAPLYILVRRLSGDLDQDAVVLANYEFLDIDSF